MIRIRIHDREKCMDTKIVDLPCIMNEFGQTDANSVMANLICIIMYMQIAGSSRQWSNQNHSMKT